MLNVFGDGDVLQNKKNFDRQNLFQLFEEGSFDNDLLMDTFLIPARVEHSKLQNILV